MPNAFQYWQALAKSFDDLEPCGTSSAGTTSTVTMPLLVNGHANASANRYDGKFLYVVSGPGAGAQRTVRTGGLNPGTGVLTFDPTTTAPTASVIALTSLFPVQPLPSEQRTDYYSLVNRALGMIAMPDRISFSVTSSTDTYATTSYPWLDRQERLSSEAPGGDPFLENPIISGRRPRQCGWRGIRLVLDGITPAFEIDAPFTGTLYVETLRPQDTLIDGSDSTTGLTAESQTAKPSVEDVVKIGRMLGIEVLMARSPGFPDGNWAAQYPAAVRAALSVKYLDRTQMSQQAMAVAEQQEAA